ncbi:Probable deferrochelatase/peroxidase YfeX [Leminorella richardii]|uniref:Probable deferrochelatase/peroxidase YfeX n=1 Tax=Leminorella richardii TaxID=158841 RepID=A0A2X4UR95_9GAMM|nr:Dyp-type peroxidase [Leminorella richardii]SQI37142.1 Probable deferrochelatase/peroxidase YfeX [Leminorella richardii]
MAQVQSGILPEHCRFGIFIEATAGDDLESIRSGCKTFISALTELQQKHPDAALGATISFGSDLWQRLSGKGAAELKPFRPLGNGLAPATQRDVLIHILSLRHDVNFTLAQAALKAFGKAISVAEEIHGFRWTEERDLSGFVDGTENPTGDARPGVCVIADGEDAGGSYVMVQRYVHNLDVWNTMPVKAQENAMGRTKVDNEELPGDKRQPTSHLGRVDLKEDGKGLKIVRQSLPYGTASGEHGLYFMAYCARLHNIEQQLLSMYGELDGKTDQLLRFSKPVTGGYYFAPSLDKLLSL